MKIIAVNSSQQKDDGPTDKILQPFLEGMRQAGAEVELFYTEDLDIRACRNCEGIMNTHDIDTCRNDDMKKLFPKFKESDVWVFATPNCTNNSSHGMRNFLDRLDPLFQLDDLSFESAFNGKPKKSGKVIYISTCRKWDKCSMDENEEMIKNLSLLFDKEYVGALLRPQSTVLNAAKDLHIHIDDVYDAAMQAGKELVVEGTISKELFATVSRDVVQEDSFIMEISRAIRK